jgi:acyl-coenzyme A thioesterase PaaI-like protein
VKFITRVQAHDNFEFSGGAITALLDNAAGLIARPSDMHRDVAAIATLDMRIDYMGAAEPGKDVHARAHCFKRTKNVAFVRAVAYTQSPQDPIATCTATFMLGTRNKPFNAAQT